MVFTARMGDEARAGAQVIQIEEGAFVYLSRGEGEQENQFVEWGDLSAAQ
jgi:hypothetical protein